MTLRIVCVAGAAVAVTHHTHGFLLPEEEAADVAESLAGGEELESKKQMRSMAAVCVNCFAAFTNMRRF